jgi:hypothetical protein
MSVKERTGPTTGAIRAFLTAITLVGLVGLGIMLGGSLALTNGAHLGEEVVALFMILIFFSVAIIEFQLIKQLSKLTDTKEGSTLEPRARPAIPSELMPPQVRTLPEPIPSVTENTTRTLQYEPKDSGNR